MKRYVLSFLVGLAALVALGVAQAAPTSGSAKTKICHRTKAGKKPYIKLSVSKSVLKGHLKHAADIIPAPVGPPARRSSSLPRRVARSCTPP